ncbi:hypothetical protein GCM10009092_03200 [Bowmanella denitrificans]|uniref:Lipoprotein n=1 Tax=Bowmanella denitrificans TaxID=366582 RepID=A0ABN0WMM1_9ALTE
MRVLFVLTGLILLSACVSQTEREKMQQMGMEVNPCNGNLEQQYEASIRLDEDAKVESSIKTHCEPQHIETQTEFEKDNRDPAQRRW